VLAGQLANIEKAFAVKVNALFLTRRLHQAHQDAERSTGDFPLDEDLAVGYAVRQGPPR